ETTPGVTPTKETTTVQNDLAQDLLVAWMHDPPDKPLKIPGHEGRAARYLSEATGRDVTAEEVHNHSADQLAAAIERIPFPRSDLPEYRVSSSELLLRHPLDASESPLSAAEIDEEAVIETIRQIVAPVSGRPDESVLRFLALWRSLPERLAERMPALAWPPADTRIPDHSLWHHLDTTAAIVAAKRWQPETGEGRSDESCAFLTFSLGPVQSFIATARSARDLWTGSMILSWLTFSAARPLLEELGPTALVYPALRGLPVVDLWLRDLGLQDVVAEPEVEALRSPCLPNRFVAVIPWGSDGELAEQFAERCEKAAREAWGRIAHAVHGELDRQLRNCRHGNGWDRFWKAQIDGFFDFRTAVLPWNEADEPTLARLLRGEAEFEKAFEQAAAIRRLNDALQAAGIGYGGGSIVGRWQHQLELCSKSLQAQRSVRHVPPATVVGPGEIVPPKCTLMGSLEQMGPATLQESAEFWADAGERVSIEGVRLRTNERLCAGALVKRFAGTAFFDRHLGVSPQSQRIPDTATIAAAVWLSDAKRRGFDRLDPQRCFRELGKWSGQWLFAPKPEAEEDDEDRCPSEIADQIRSARSPRQLGPPPPYYGVLMMDGDRMGEWLRGALAPKLGDVLHPKAREFFANLDRSVVERALNTARPVTPALHAAISEALANFAVRVVPPAIRENLGTLIYAGGDDVLALLPTANALQAALELRNAFSQNWHETNGSPRLLMGEKATMSAGIAVVHHKEDLRFALAQARAAEKQAKDLGRDALVLRVCRRSGEHSTALCPWEFVPTVEGWVQVFRGRAGGTNGRPGEGASDRWAYHLRGETHVLSSMPQGAVEAEIRRLVNRAEQPTRIALGETQGRTAGDVMVEAFRTYRRLVHETQRRLEEPEVIEHFVTLCQSASFLARGRDE
ncbi:MAG: type III-B CRISPR-associated protein Cas10/Cmr2, partial [Planctomycetota bacterium]